MAGKEAVFEDDIELKLADCPEQVAAMVRETIQKVYSNYYPQGAVKLFLDLYSKARIDEYAGTNNEYEDGIFSFS